MSTTGRPHGNAVTSDAIVGRRRELDALRTWLDAARTSRGCGRLVLCAGEPGIAKSRLARELAGLALASGAAVAWGRCLEGDIAPSLWPWRQVLRSLGIDPDPAVAGDVESPEDRFRVFDNVAAAVRDAAGDGGLVVILDDVHWADEPSLLVLRHLADHIADSRLLVLVTLRDVEPSPALPRVLPDLLRSPVVERIDLRRFDLAEVGEQLSKATAGASASGAKWVLEVTAGNPLFVREIARALADGTWRPDRPPRSVLDVVSARLDRISADCRRLVQAAAIVGHEFPVALVAAVLGEPVGRCLPLVDEAIAYGLLEPAADAGSYRFVHALTRDAVEASLGTAHRAGLHRAVAEAIETHFADDLSEHLSEIARHWGELAAYGDAEMAHDWAVRAADDAVRRLAFEQGVRLYRSALELGAHLADEERCRVLIALGHAAWFAGDLRGGVDAAAAAADAAGASERPELVAEAALVVLAAPDPGVNAIAKELCERALGQLGDDTHVELRARLLAQRSHLAFYDGNQDRVEALSAAALALARESGDDLALLDALHARQEACPGPSGRSERMRLATEMLSLAQRTNSARSAMWGRLWRLDVLIERGQLAAAAEELPVLRLATDRLGGPVGAWHLDRASACVAQAQGRYAEAAALGRRAFERMRPIEPAPATGAYFALVCALASHVGMTEEAEAFARQPFEGPPRFKTMARLSRAFLLVRAGLPDEAAASYQQAGPLQTWSLPAFFTLPGHVYGALVTADLGLDDDLAVLLDRLEAFRGEHAIGNAVAYMGPIELTLGRGRAALGDLDGAIDDLGVAAEQADRAGVPGFAAEARYHLATSLLARNRPGDHDRALDAAHDADRLARSLGMTAYVDRSSALVARLGAATTGPLSRRESEVAALVAGGLTNRQIAERLVISARTAQNHVQHILTKLGFTRRSQVAAWVARRELDEQSNE